MEDFRDFRVVGRGKEEEEEEDDDDDEGGST